MKKFVIAAILTVFMFTGIYTNTVYAEETKISGNTYEFGDADYKVQPENNEKSKTQAIGKLEVEGSFHVGSEIDNVCGIVVDDGNLNVSYVFDKSKLETAEDKWHIIDDKIKDIDDISLKENIKSGAFIVQTSTDGKRWVTDTEATDIFSQNTDFKNPAYTSKDVQLENGCYYRFIAVYKLGRKTGEKKLAFLKKDTIEENRIAEIYEFYAVSSATNGNTISAMDKPRKELGEKINTGKNNSYSGKKEIDKNDPHFGWNLGTFTINGFTRETSDGENPVFLKNVGDRVTLWFTLKQDINCLNNDKALSINENKKASDQKFEVPETNFKHGALIISYTDSEGNKHDPIIYTDFLAANAKTGADTRVQLFEEGDYDVTLDYEIKDDPRKIGSVSVVPTYSDYKIEFQFKIRNGNCMVYPFDNVTGSELSDNAITPNGFRLDMAKSRYLTIDVTKSNINVGNNGLITEDVRFNRPAKDNDEYTDEGIYVFTVKNLYTEGEPTKKIIYVGDNKYLKALSKNKLSIDLLNKELSNGSTVTDDGTIKKKAIKNTAKNEKNNSSVKNSKGGKKK